MNSTIAVAILIIAFARWMKYEMDHAIMDEGNDDDLF